MRKLILSITVLAVMLMSQGCNDLLNQPQPSESIAQQTALSDAGAVDAMRASMYDRLHGFDFITRYMIGPDALADNTSIRGSATRFLGLNQNSDANAGRSGMNDGTYNDVYNLVQDANLMIGAVSDDVDMSQSQLERYRGEAYLFRAFAMHHLVRVLGYEPGMAVDGWTKGIIVRTEPTLTASDADNRSRSSVSDVYAQIKSDLDKAINMLPSLSSAGPNYVNTAFANALKARVHLYAGEWGNAASAANAALAEAPALVSDSATVADMFNENGPNHPESVFTLTVDPNTESLGVNDSPAVYTAQQYVAQLPTNSLIDLYDADDNRLGWYAPCPSGISACATVNDEGWIVTKWNNDLGQYTDNVPYMRTAELKLIAAEGEAKDNNAVTPTALGHLNDLRQARGLGPAAPASVDAFMDEIMEERRRELVVEGHRFFDLKRLGMNIPFPDGSIKMRYDNSYKIIDDISPSEIETNKKLEQNPGY